MAVHPRYILGSPLLQIKLILHVARAPALNASSGRPVVNLI